MEPECELQMDMIREAPRGTYDASAQAFVVAKSQAISLKHIADLLESVVGQGHSNDHHIRTAKDY